MRFLILAIALSSCSSATTTAPRPADVLLSPVSVKKAPSPHRLHKEKFAFDWGDRQIKAYLADTKLKIQSQDLQRMYGFGPVIEVRTKSDIRVLDLRNRLPSSCISNVFHDQWNTRIWVLLQSCIEGPSPAYTLWISEDGGEHWFQGADLERPAPRFPPSELFTLFVDGKGKGEAWFKLDASHGTADASRGADLSESQELIYKSSTLDGGRSWIVGRIPVAKNGMLEAGRERD